MFMSGTKCILGACGSQKRPSDPLELVVVSHAGNQARIHRKSRATSSPLENKVFYYSTFILKPCHLAQWTVPSEYPVSLRKLCWDAQDKSSVGKIQAYVIWGLF